MINSLVKPNAFIASHASEEATKDDQVIAGTRTEVFIKASKVPVYITLSGKTMSIDAMADLAAQWRSQGYELGFGVGIAHGFTTLRRIGFEGRYDCTTIGSVVKQAARLCDDAGR